MANKAWNASTARARLEDIPLREIQELMTAKMFALKEEELRRLEAALHRDEEELGRKEREFSEILGDYVAAGGMLDDELRAAITAAGLETLLSRYTVTNANTAATPPLNATAVSSNNLPVPPTPSTPHEAAASIPTYTTSTNLSLASISSEEHNQAPAGAIMLTPLKLNEASSSATDTMMLATNMTTPTPDVAMFGPNAVGTASAATLPPLNIHPPKRSDISEETSEEVSTGHETTQVNLLSGAPAFDTNTAMSAPNTATFASNTVAASSFGSNEENGAALDANAVPSAAPFASNTITTNPFGPNDNTSTPTFVPNNVAFAPNSIDATTSAADTSSSFASNNADAAAFEPNHSASATTFGSNPVNDATFAPNNSTFASNITPVSSQFDPNTQDELAFDPNNPATSAAFAPNTSDEALFAPDAAPNSSNIIMLRPEAAPPPYAVRSEQPTAGGLLTPDDLLAQVAAKLGAKR